MSLLTCSRAIPANDSVIKGIQIPDEINTTWISAQLSKITSLSSGTMVCPSEILQSNQSCSGQQGQIYWEASVVFPFLAEPLASASWGDAGLLYSCTVALAMLQLWFGKHLPKGHGKVILWHFWEWMAWAILFLVVGFFILSLSPLPVTCCQSCAVAVCEDFFFCLFSLLYNLAYKILTLCWHFIT